VGALLGFLLWNWSPAKVFMGDVGSTFLGAVFAGLVLQASSWPQALALLLVAMPLLADACLCVPRRLLAGQRVFQDHRLHLFQRLHQAGWPHARVSLTYIAATAVLAVALLLWSCWWGCGWISVWRCCLQWRLRGDGIRAQGDAVLGFFDDSRSADELVAGIPVLGLLGLAWDVKTKPCPEGASTPVRGGHWQSSSSPVLAARAGGRRGSSGCSGSSPCVRESISSVGSRLRGVGRRRDQR